MNLKTLLSSLLLCASQVFAAPLTVLVPASVASSGDISARILAPLLERELNTEIIVVNKPGADGLIGLNYFLTQNPNNTILIGTANIAAQNYSTLVEPVHGLVGYDVVIAVAKSSNIHTLKDLIKKKTLLGGGSGIYSTKSMKLLDKQLKTVTIDVNYKDRAIQMMDLSNGLLDYSIVGTGNAAFISMMKLDKLRVIASVDNTRSKLFPNAPTLKEYKYESVEGFAWSGVFINPQASNEFKQKINSTIYKIVNSSEFANLVQANNFTVLPLSKQELNSLVNNNIEIFKQN